MIGSPCVLRRSQLCGIRPPIPSPGCSLRTEIPTSRHSAACSTAARVTALVSSSTTVAGTCSSAGRRACRSEAISPVQNKLGQFVANPLPRTHGVLIADPFRHAAQQPELDATETNSPRLRNIIDAPRNRIDLRRIMDRGQILIVNLSQGRIGEPASNLLGAFLVPRRGLLATPGTTLLSLHACQSATAVVPSPGRSRLSVKEKIIH